jgi:hypothetical protein
LLNFAFALPLRAFLFLKKEFNMRNIELEQNALEILENINDEDLEFSFDEIKTDLDNFALDVEAIY